MVGDPFWRACVLAATLPGMLAMPGCMPGEYSMTAAAGEPPSDVTIALTVHGDSYDIDRWYLTASLSLWQGRALVVPRASVPADCAAARFVIDDAGTPLRVAEPVALARITAVEPPRPVGEGARCTLRLSSGTFEQPERREGLVVTSTSGVVAYAAREPAQPSYYVLTPVEAYAEVWAFSLGVLALPVLLPIGMAMGAAERTQRAEAEAALPVPVAGCWRLADQLMQKDGPDNPGRRYGGLVWVSTGPEAYALRPDSPADDVVSAAAARTVVTLRGGRVLVRTEARSLYTDADVDCTLQDGAVLGAAVRLRP